MHLWRLWLLPLLYHALKGARGIYQRSAVLVIRTSPSLYKQEDEPIGEIGQCDGLQDKGIDGNVRDCGKDPWSPADGNLLSKFMALSFPSMKVAMLDCLDFLFG